MREAIGIDLYNQCVTGGVAKTLNAIKSDSDHVPCVMVVQMALASIAPNAERTDGKLSPTLMARAGTGGGQLPILIMKEDRNGLEHRERTSTRCGESERRGQQNAELHGRSDEDYVGGCDDMDTIVRRLTPMECERLQGFPDGWTDIGEWTDTKGKKHQTTDSARYKALGNSIAVGYANNCSGFWMWVMKRISAQYTRNATLGSLFDGIGGFPLAWETYNGKGSARWASEIEEFPIAVTKLRFPEEP